MEQREEITEQTPHEELLASRSAVEKLKRLLEDQDYLYLIKIQQEKLDQLVLSTFSAPSGLDSVVTNIYNQGKAAGFQEAMSFAMTLKAGMEGNVEKLSFMEDETNETGKGE